MGHDGLRAWYDDDYPPTLGGRSTSEPQHEEYELQGDDYDVWKVTQRTSSSWPDPLSGDTDSPMLPEGRRSNQWEDNNEDLKRFRALHKDSTMLTYKVRTLGKRFVCRTLARRSNLRLTSSVCGTGDLCPSTSDAKTT